MHARYNTHIRMQNYKATCRCGQVELQALGRPIVHISCYCDDCQAAAAMIDALPGGCSGIDADGGTRNILFRRDHVRFVRGEALLQSYQLKPTSPTHRLVASCCNTAITQRHDNHWPHRGIKTQLFESPLPPLQLRMFTRYAPDPSAIPRDVPCAGGVPASFAFRLLRAMLALRLSALASSGLGSQV